MRSVFQEQQEISHLYLGSKRHMMRRIFNDENEPFWRSTKQIELDVVEAGPFARYIAHQFKRSGRKIATTAIDAVLDITHGHHYATQELCYFLSQDTPDGSTAALEQVAQALAGVLNSEHAHFSLVWESASARSDCCSRPWRRSPGDHWPPTTDGAIRCRAHPVSSERLERSRRAN